MAQFEIQGDRIFKDGAPFFILGVYYQRTPSTNRLYGHPAPWNELENSGFNTVNLMDPFPAGPSTPYTGQFKTYEGFISADHGNIPWLKNRYNNPQNAQNILRSAATHNLFIIADQGPFIPNGAKGLNGTNFRRYGVSKTGNKNIITRNLRHTLIDNLTGRWPEWGVHHPNFLGWCALDEPVWFWAPWVDEGYKGKGLKYNSVLVRQLYQSVVLDSYSRIKAKDEHPVFMNFAFAHGSAFPQPRTSISYNDNGELIVNGKNIKREYVRDLKLYSNAADVISMDIYPMAAFRHRNPSGHDPYCIFQDRTLSVIGKYQKLLNEEVVEHKKPVLQVLQSWSRNRSDSRTHLTPVEVRFQAYDSIINGAAGLMWFGWHACGESNDPTWNRTKDLVRTELSHPAFYPVLSAAPSPRQPQVGVDVDDIEFALRNYHGHNYLIAANRSNRQKHTATFSGFSASATQAEVMFEEGRAHALFSNGKLTDSFAPFGVHVYRVRDWSGILAEDTIWDGLVRVTGDVTVPAGITLTVAPGTVIEVAAGDDQSGGLWADRTELIVEGTLSAQQDGQRKRVVFKSADRPRSNDAWGGIHIRSGGRAIFRYVHIKNAREGIGLDGTATVDWSAAPGEDTDISHSTVGIYGKGLQLSTIQNVDIRSCVTGVKLENCFRTVIRNLQAFYLTDTGIEISGRAQNAVLDNIIVGGPGKVGVKLYNTLDTSLHHNYLVRFDQDIVAEWESSRVGAGIVV